MIKQELLIDDFIDLNESRKFCNVWAVAAVVGGAAVVNGLVGAYTASNATDAQVAAQNKAIAVQQQQYAQTRSDLSGYRDMGGSAGKTLQDQLPFLTSPISMDQATLEKTPGYQFAKTQGLKAVQNSAAARGLGVSGAALKGAATFATGLADNTYQNQFNNENVNRTNAYNRLKGLVDTGENAAAQTGTFGAIAANNISSSATGIGNAEAAGANKIGNSVTAGVNNLSGYAMYKGLYGGSGDPSLPQAGVNAAS